MPCGSARAALAVSAACLTAQEAKGGEGSLKAPQDNLERLEYQMDEVRKSNDDILWFTRLADTAEVDKMILTGPPNPRCKQRCGIKNERNPLRIYHCVFVPGKHGRTR